MRKLSIRKIRRVSYAVLAVAALLSACTTQPGDEPRTTPATSPEPPSLPADKEPIEVLDAYLEEFCADISRIIVAESDGFAPLRDSRKSAKRWHGRLIPKGLIDCTIDGSKRPLATYDCRSQPLAGRHQGLLEGEFYKTAADLDHCLGQPQWYPKEWRRGRVVEFGRGEKQITWRDITASPKPTVSLHIEENYAQRVHYLKLAFGTLN